MFFVSNNSPTLSSVNRKTAGLKFVGTIMQPDEKEKIQLNPWHKQGSYKLQQKSLKSLNMASTSAGWNFKFWRQNHRPTTQNVGWKFSLLFILIFFGLYKSAESGRSSYILHRGSPVCTGFISAVPCLSNLINKRHGSWTLLLTIWLWNHTSHTKSICCKCIGW